MNKWSDLDFDTQQKVNRALKANGLAGIGYYYIDTHCTNCGKKGIAIYEKGVEAYFGAKVECVGCRTSNVFRRDELKEATDDK